MAGATMLLIITAASTDTAAQTTPAPAGRAGSQTQDYAQLRARYEKAAAAGDAKAMYNLGLLYRDGLGVAQDYAQARHWFEKSVAASNAKAMERETDLLSRRGVTPEEMKAGRSGNASEPLVWDPDWPLRKSE